MMTVTCTVPDSNVEFVKRFWSAAQAKTSSTGGVGLTTITARWQDTSQCPLDTARRMQTQLCPALKEFCDTYSVSLVKCEAVLGDPPKDDEPRVMPGRD